MVTNNKSKILSVSIIIYFSLLAGMLGIVIYLNAKNTAANPIDVSAASNISDITWYDDTGSEVSDLSNLYLLGSDNTSVSCILPEDLAENQALCFRTKHTYFEVYVDDQLIYTQTLSDNSLYTNSNGVTWDTIPLFKAYAGHELTIQYQLRYNEAGCGFDHMVIGSEKYYILDVLRDKGFALVLSYTYFILGVILLVVDLLISKRFQQPHSLFYLGFIAITVSAYCMVETQVFQIFISDLKIMHLLSLFSMLAVPIPVVMYAETLFAFRWRYTSITASILSFILFLATTILNAWNILDYHESMTSVHIMLFLSFGMMLYSIIRYLIQVLKKRIAFDQYVLFMIIGLVIIVLCGAMDVFRFYNRHVLDPALFTRVGFLGTIICFVIASSRKIIDMFKLNTRLEFVTKLAYKDGLTGLYNRTSYNEKLQEFDEAGVPLGIVMFDINNLKQVNDHIGHDAGDELLVLSADMIKQAFDKSGMTCFRIGGDEFVVLVNTDSIQEDCLNSISKLEQLYSEYNEDDTRSFDIVIAKGYYCYTPHTNISIEHAVQLADKYMYQNKQELKQADAMRDASK